MYEERQDCRVWAPSKDGNFSIASFFPASLEGSHETSPLHALWKFKVPPRVAVFGWLALHGRILNLDNLRRRKIIIVNACPLCLASEETVDHLLLNCKVVQAVWKSVIGWFDCSWVLPSSLLDLFDAWKKSVGNARGKVM